MSRATVSWWLEGGRGWEVPGAHRCHQRGPVSVTRGSHRHLPVLPTSTCNSLLAPRSGRGTVSTHRSQPPPSPQHTDLIHHQVVFTFVRIAALKRRGQLEPKGLRPPSLPPEKCRRCEQLRSPPRKRGQGCPKPPSHLPRAHVVRNKVLLFHLPLLAAAQVLGDGSCPLPVGQRQGALGWGDAALGAASRCAQLPGQAAPTWGCGRLLGHGGPQRSLPCCQLRLRLLPKERGGGHCSGGRHGLPT